MRKNKKILNATTVKDNNIEFKSKLEKTIYNVFFNNGFKLEYESKRFLLWDGFQPITPFYDRKSNKLKSSKEELELKNRKVTGIRYTPDFYLNINGVDIYIEVKGKENDVFYIKKKLFRKFLDTRLIEEGVKSMYFEVYNKSNAMQVIDIIKQISNEKHN